MFFLRVFFTFLSLASLASSDNTPHDFMESVVGVYVEYYDHNTGQNKAFGSGVIVSEDGYIVTNHHVIQQAMQIVVQTHEGQRAVARVIGAAPEFDISVLKIEPLPNQPFKPISIGESHHLHAGDSVTAIGNAFGFDQTLTHGVVIHIDRQVSLSSRVKSYIQVDAAVNPGNSGGALVNKNGELVGIVSGIFGPKFNIGIAFAIPADIATPVIKQLINKGHVNPGWIGMATQSLTPEIKDALDISNHDGVLVSEVYPGSPAERANLEAKDVILAVNDINILSPQHFASLITAQGNQTLLSMSYLRGHKVFTTRIKTDSPHQRPNNSLGTWGLNLMEYQHMQLDGKVDQGIEVHQVSYPSSAALSGIQTGDVIKSVDNIPIRSFNDIKQNAFQPNKTHLIEIQRQQQIFFVPIR